MSDYLDCQITVEVLSTGHHRGRLTEGRPKANAYVSLSSKYNNEKLHARNGFF